MSVVLLVIGVFFGLLDYTVRIEHETGRSFVVYRYSRGARPSGLFEDMTDRIWLR